MTNITVTHNGKTYTLKTLVLLADELKLAGSGDVWIDHQFTEEHPEGLWFLVRWNPKADYIGSNRSTYHLDPNTFSISTGEVSRAEVRRVLLKELAKSDDGSYLRHTRTRLFYKKWIRNIASALDIDLTATK